MKMKTFIKKMKHFMPSKRKFIQLYAALLFNANLKGFISGNIYQGKTKILCAPGINCYSCPGAVAACPLGSLQGSFSADRSTLYYVGGILLLYSLMFGRMICGWLCPFGLIQELMYKITTPKLKKSKVTRILSYLKYVILVFFVFIVPIMYAFRDMPFPAFCKYICPAGTIEGGIGLLANKVNASYFSMLGPLFTWKFLLMVSILVGSIFIFRLFCRFLCPLGALYGFFNKISFFGVKVNDAKCVGCNLCIKKCKMDIHHVGDQECISCGECIAVCPTKAILWKGPKLQLISNEMITSPHTMDSSKDTDSVRTKRIRLITRSISVVLLLGLLIGAIAYYWNQKPAFVVPEVGYEVGDSCSSYELTVLDKTGILDKTFDPTKTGKITIINFWGTWCTPCVNELPYFDQIASEYKENVTVVAIHSSMSSETAPGYILNHYPDSNMIFAKDDSLDADGLVGKYYSALGGRGTYPYTIIIDENGVIVEVFVKALHYEDLKRVVDEQLEK